MNRAIEPDFKKMTYEELRAFFYQNDVEEVLPYSTEIKDRLASLCWDIGLLWDALEGVDPDNGYRGQHGTPNKRSMTYKIRKLMGYSYP